MADETRYRPLFLSYNTKVLESMMASFLLFLLFLFVFYILSGWPVGCCNDSCGLGLHSAPGRGEGLGVTFRDLG